MVIRVLNGSHAEDAAQMLLAPHLTAFADVDVIAGQKHFPAHRAVLAVHSLDFREAFASPPPPPPDPPSPVLFAPTMGSLSGSAVVTLLHRDHHADASSSSATSAPPSQAGSTSAAAAPPQPRTPKFPNRYRVHIVLEDVDDATLSHGWALVYDYIYGATVQLETEAVLAALPICRRYRFDELANALDDFLVEGAVSPVNCTRVFAAAGIRAFPTPSLALSAKPPLAAGRVHAVQPGLSVRAGRAPPRRRRRRESDTHHVQRAAWNVMKAQFSDVTDWGRMPYGALVHLLKLNDLRVRSEQTVFDAVVAWTDANRSRIDGDVVVGLVKLVRFPTMGMAELERCAGSSLVRDFPVCRKYVSRGLAARADEMRGLVRSVVMENSPVYRRRRTDALTFADRIPNWSRVDKSVQTSSRFFADCLWSLVIELDDEMLGLFLACMSESDGCDVNVELDFTVFVVRHSSGVSPGPQTGADADAEPDLLRKEVKGACFSRSGQRIGFRAMVRRSDLQNDAGQLLLRDTLFIGASIRLRSSDAHVVAISNDCDDTAESVTTVV